MGIKYPNQFKKLSYFIATGLLSSCFISDCSGSGDSSSANSTLNVNVNSSVPSSIVENNNTIFEAMVSVSGSQSANAALFMLGADTSQVLSTITGINFPTISGANIKQIIPNGSEVRDCTVGLQFSNEAPNCILKVVISGDSGVDIDDQITIETDAQALNISIKTKIIDQGSTVLPQGEVTPEPTLAPDAITQVKVINQASNTEAFNNLTLTMPSWLHAIASNFQGGTVSTNEDGSKTITFTENGLNKNLVPDQTHIFSFDLAGNEQTRNVLLDHFFELIDNAKSGVLTVNASNMRNPMKPKLMLSLVPAIIEGSIILSDPDVPQAVIFANLSNSQLRLTEIDGSNLPEGVSINNETTCSTENDINPAGDAGDTCRIVLGADVTVVPENDKSLMIKYADPQGNVFIEAIAVKISGAEVSLDFNSIELPNNGDQITNISITNTGALNWKPSDLVANYEITKSSESTLAENIVVTNPTAGINCLSSEIVSPGQFCNIGIQANADNTDIGDYVLALAPANNLTEIKETNFSVTESTKGSFQFQDDAGQAIMTHNFEIGVDPFTLKVVNVGAVPVRDFSLTIPGHFMQENNTCDNSTTLAVGNNNSCQVNLSVANGSGIGNGNGIFSVVANGNESAVDNNGETLSATVQGAVVNIESGVTIPQPNVDTTITPITITNIGASNSIAWFPSTDVNDYLVLGDNTEGISIVDPGDTGKPYCLSTAIDQNGNIIPITIPVSESCDIGIQVENTANVGNYTLLLNLANNLAQESSQSFDITSTLGFFSFSPSTIVIGTDSTTQPQTITLRNDGETDITNVHLVESELLLNNTCGSSDETITLASQASCTFDLGFTNELQGSFLEISAIGDQSTVENNNLSSGVNIDGVVVEVQQINNGNSINRPAVGTQIINVEIKNLSSINWTPLANTDDYQIFPDNANISIVAPSENINCLIAVNAGGIAPSGSCYLGIKIDKDTPLQNYRFQVLESIDQDGAIILPQKSNKQNFNVTESLGYFTYSGDGIEDNDVTLTVGGQPVKVTLENIGETDITNLMLNTGADQSRFNVSDANDDNYCNNLADSTLSANTNCTFLLSLSEQAQSNQTYIFSTTGTDVSNSPSELSVNKVNIVGIAFVTDTVTDSVTRCTLNENGDFIVCVDAAAANSVKTGFSSPRGITLNTDNTIAFVTNPKTVTDPASVTRCTLNENGDFIVCVDAAAANSVKTGFSFPMGITLNTDNTIAFVADLSTDSVIRCTLNENGDFIACADAAAANSLKPGFSSPRGITLNTDNTIAFVADPGTNPDSVIRCTLNENGDFIACADAAAANSVKTGFSFPMGITLNTDNTIAFVTDPGTVTDPESVIRCTLNENGDFIACADAAAANSVKTGFSFPMGITLNTDNTIAFVTDTGTDSVIRCTLNENGDFIACADAAANSVETRFPFPSGIIFLDLVDLEA